MTVKVEKPPLRGDKPLYSGRQASRSPFGLWWKQAVAFSGNKLLHDWWYWKRRIAKEQSRLTRVNKAKA
ncbi:MAG: hypothetical protein ACP5KV_08015 [Candidatus Methanomethylicaceae archaeon]